MQLREEQVARVQAVAVGIRRPVEAVDASKDQKAPVDHEELAEVAATRAVHRGFAVLAAALVGGRLAVEDTRQAAAKPERCHSLGVLKGLPVADSGR